MHMPAHWILPRPSRYETVWHAMQTATAARGPLTHDAIWLTEHEPVYTLGQAGKPEHVLAAAHIPVVATDRGGQVTYHGPGQLVAYILHDLRRANRYVKDYVYRLEEAVLATLACCGLEHATRFPGAPGVYVAQAGADPARDPLAHFQKIAALGVKVRNGCTYHGVALNVAMDLQPFAGINPCGHRGLAVTDLASQGLPLSVDTVAAHLVRELQRQLASPATGASIATRTLPDLVADFQAPCMASAS